MKDLRRRFERFCFTHRNWGIPNLMLYVSVGAALINLMGYIDSTNSMYFLLCFNRVAIMQGQIWRLVTYPLCYSGGSLLLTAVTLYCYYTIGRSIESSWGTLRFNLFYLIGVVLMDVWCMIFGGAATSYYLNMSLFLAFATMYPDTQFLLFFFIPVKAWIFALLDLILVVIGLFQPFPANVYPLIALGNYFLFFGKDVVNVLPLSWRAKLRRSARGTSRRPGRSAPKVIPFDKGAARSSAKPDYHHKCTVCGRTDRSDPNLEFRYCSRCKGYYCYCSEHISNHAHIQ